MGARLKDWRTWAIIVLAVLPQLLRIAGVAPEAIDQLVSAVTVAAGYLGVTMPVTTRPAEQDPPT